MCYTTIKHENYSQWYHQVPVQIIISYGPCELVIIQVRPWEVLAVAVAVAVAFAVTRIEIEEPIKIFWVREFVLIVVFKATVLYICFIIIVVYVILVRLRHWLLGGLFIYLRRHDVPVVIAEAMLWVATRQGGRVLAISINRGKCVLGICNENELINNYKYNHANCHSMIKSARMGRSDI